jgi:hypothetical protein
MLALLAGLWGGLVRLGWSLPALRPALAGAHGPLMIAGFLGTLIGLERAVALGGWAYAAPLLTALAAAALLVGPPGPAAPLLMTAGSGVFLAVLGRLLARDRARYLAVMALGACLWIVGNALWLGGWPLYRVAPWWGGFLVLTIAGERLDLARLRPARRGSGAAFLGAAAVFVLGVGLSAVRFDAGLRLAGFGMVGLALWLGRNDIARRSLHEVGLARFMAVCLLSGYVWLGVAGLLALVLGGVMAGPHYDALLHALFLGFVFAMVFAHAPVILPGILGRPVVFRPTFYVPPAMLHVTLAARLAGDLVPWPAVRRWAGLLNAVVLVLFFVRMGAALRAAPRGR